MVAGSSPAGGTTILFYVKQAKECAKPRFFVRTPVKNYFQILQVIFQVTDLIDDSIYFACYVMLRIHRRLVLTFQWIDDALLH